MLKNFLTFHVNLPKMFHSGLVYKYNCGDSNFTYYGTTKLNFEVIQVCEHLDISRFTVKNFMLLYNVYLPLLRILLSSVKHLRTVKTETLQFYHLNFSSEKFMANCISLTHLAILKLFLHYLLLFKTFLIFQDNLRKMLPS